MKNLCKFGKKFMAYVMAIAILAVSLFTGVAVTASAQSCGGTVVEKWDKVSDGVTGDWYDGTFETGDGTQNNPFIISSAEELAWVCKNTTVENSKGVYYKVDDSIKAFDMNTVSDVDLTVDGLTANQVKEMVAGKILGKVWHPGYAGCFAGSFDGNGVTIYGLYAGPAYYNQSSFDNNQPYGCNYAALFSKIDATTASFKNFSIKNSYFTGEVSAAVYAESVVNSGSATIENVMVSNCYIESTSGDKYGGVLVGFCRYDSPTGIASKVKINNCLVYDNVVSNKATSAVRLVGIMEAYCADASGNKVRDYDNFSITNTVAIGCDIENTGSWWQKDSKFFKNCYTTGTPATENTTIIKLADANAAKGSAAVENLSGLNASDWFFNTTTYPEPAVFHDITTVDNGDGTHSASCGCGLSSVAIAHVYEDGVCACGVAAKCGEIVSVYSGTPDTKLEGSGTVEDPYLVKSADEFAAVALGYIASTEDTYFKVDGVDAFYMNDSEAVADLTNANDVKEYFANNGATAKMWKNNASFIGQFDGNGATVYGVYANHTGQYDYAGLFPKVDGHSSIKNIAVKNSYFSSYSKDGAIAALVGGTIWTGDGNTNTSIAVENVLIANNYLASTNSGVQHGASVLMGRFFEKHYPTINNCIMYGNLVENAYTGVDVRSGMITECPASYENFKVNNVIAIGVTPWTIVDKGDGTYAASGWYLSVLNTGHFKNIYTDQSTDKLQAFQPTNNSAEILEKYNINSIATADMMGVAAVENLASLGADWIFDANGYPEPSALHDAELSATLAEDNYAGHIAVCSCGIGAGIVNTHTYEVDDATLGWDAEYKCTVCGFVCDHMNMDNVTMEEWEADCVTDGGYSGSCTCGFAITETYGDCEGHKFTAHEAEAGADCQTAGTIAYKECSVCGKNYAADAADKEPFENALTDLTGEKGTCVPKTEGDKIAYGKDDDNHWTTCSACNEIIETTAHTGEATSNGAEGHSLVCTVCGYASENVAHVFTNGVCGECDYACAHAYDNACDADCNECDVTREVPDHVYDNACDTDCNECGDVREVPDHVFTNGVCSECKFECAHAYDNVCDTDCNLCDITREVPNHVFTDGVCGECGYACEHAYDNACDTDCNECGAIREVPDHVYDDEADADCNECGDVRLLAWDITVDVTGTYTIAPNAAYTAEFDAADIVVLDKNGNEVKATENGYPLVKDVVYTVEFVSTDLLANVEGDLAWDLTKEDAKLFPDTNNGDWYGDAVNYVVGAGIMSGYASNGKFGTSDSIQRQDFIVMLARYAGADLAAYDYDCTLKDVAADGYYKAAINWALDMGITTGYDDGTFGVGDKMTREQLVTFLYRYANIIGVDTTVDDATKAEAAAKYADFGKVSPFSTDAIVWALSKGVISGQGGVKVDPQGGAQRCQVAQIMYNIFANDIFAV